MRDLSARLREIVRRERGPAADGAAVPAPPACEDVYVDGKKVSSAPVPPDSGGHASVADVLGGTLHQSGDSTCIAIDRVWRAESRHGRVDIGALVPDAGLPVALFDPRAADVADWARRPVFFDVETTGLSGGAGTLAFLAGCGWFDELGFRVRQFFLIGPGGEPALLDALTAIFGEASMLVSYNGRTFDVPLMETRWAYHRRACPTDDLPHFDMLPPARRLWGRRDLRLGGARARAADDTGPSACSLSSLERTVLGVRRHDDVPGFEIPTRYFHFLRTGDASAISGVLSHNQYDIVSLAALFMRALTLAHHGPDGDADPAELAALGRLYERAGQTARAARAYEQSAETAGADLPVCAHALARLAVLHRREARYDAAAAAWQRVIELTSSGRAGGLMPMLARQAAEALAIHHEHRARDLGAARQYATTLRGQSSGRAAADLEHRLERIERKMKQAERTDGFGWDAE